MRVRSAINRFTAFAWSDRIWWNGLAAVGSRIQTVLVAIFCARVLGQEKFGELALLQNTVSLFAVFASGGLSSAATRYIAHYTVVDPQRVQPLYRSLGRIVTVLTVALILLAAAARGASSDFANATGTSFTTFLCVIAVVVASVGNSCQQGVLIGLEEFKSFAACTFISGALGTIVQLLLAIYAGINGALVGAAVTLVIGWTATSFVVRKRLSAFQSNAYSWKAEVRPVVMYGLPSFISLLTTTAALWFAGVLLSRSSEGAAKMAAFGISQQWRSLILFVPSIICQVALPRFARHFAVQNSVSVRGLLRKAIILIALATIPPVAVVSIGGSKILSIYGAGFSTSYAAFLLFIWSAVIQSLVSPLIKILESSGFVWDIVGMNLAHAAILLSMFICFGRSLIALSIAFVASFIVHGIVLIIVARFRMTKTLPIIGGTGALSCETTQ